MRLPSQCYKRSNKRNIPFTLRWWDKKTNKNFLVSQSRQNLMSFFIYFRDMNQFLL